MVVFIGEAVCSGHEVEAGIILETPGIWGRIWVSTQNTLASYVSTTGVISF